MEFQEGFLKMINNDIQRIEEADRKSYTEQLNLHRELDGRYQACIKNWFSGLFAINANLSQVYYRKLEDNPCEIINNLNMMKAKLESFRFRANAITEPEGASTNVKVITNVNLNVTFEQVRSQIKDMTSLTDEQTNEVLAKVDEIEDVVNGNGNKKSKWEKIKPVLVWLADKSFDVAMKLLPLLLKIQ